MKWKEEECKRRVAGFRIVFLLRSPLAKKSFVASSSLLLCWSRARNVAHTSSLLYCYSAGVNKFGGWYFLIIVSQFQDRHLPHTYIVFKKRLNFTTTMQSLHCAKFFLPSMPQELETAFCNWFHPSRIHSIWENRVRIKAAAAPA